MARNRGRTSRSLTPDANQRTNATQTQQSFDHTSHIAHHTDLRPHRNLLLAFSLMMMNDTGDSSSLFSTALVVSEEKKKCLTKVLQVFQNLENNNNSQQQQHQGQISNVLQLHNDLSHCLSPPKAEDDVTIHESISKYFIQLRLGKTTDTKTLLEKEREESWMKQLFEYLAIEADLYRAMALTSMYLMQILPQVLASNNNNNPLSEQHVQEGLRSCAQRSKLLLKIIDQRIQSVLENRDEMTMSNLLLEHYTSEYYEQLENWLVEYDALDMEDDNTHNNIIPFDREQLQLEEEELLHMASTPTPQEKEESYIIPSSAQSSALNKDSPSVRLIQVDATSTDAENHDSTDNNKSPSSNKNNNRRSSQYSTLVVFNDQQGVFRSQHPQEQAWWWMLTSESSVVQCAGDDDDGSNTNPNPTTRIAISSVLSNRPQLANVLTVIQLQMKSPQDMTLWWSRISKFVHSLQPATDLQNEVASLWPSNEVEAKLQQARSIIISTN